MDQSPGCVLKGGVAATGVIAVADDPIAADVSAFMEATADADADEEDDVGVTAELTAAIDAADGDAIDILLDAPPICGACGCCVVAIDVVVVVT